MTRRELLHALAAVGLLAACRSTTSTPAPVPIALGRDECAYCRMLIDDPHLAAEFVAAGRTAYKFGEPGCLVNWLRGQTAPRGTAFVTDAAQGGWLPAEAAVYVRGLVRTPMSFDLAAYRVRPAEAPAETLREWRTLLSEGIAGAPRG